jgi:hypothetical protein
MLIPASGFAASKLASALEFDRLQFISSCEYLNEKEKEAKLGQKNWKVSIIGVSLWGKKEKFFSNNYLVY